MTWLCTGMSNWCASLYGPIEPDEPIPPAPPQRLLPINTDFLSDLSSMPGGKSQSAPERYSRSISTPSSKPELVCQSETPLLAASIFVRGVDDKAWLISHAEDLSSLSWWYRSKAREFLMFGSRQVAQHLSPGQKESVMPDDEHNALEYCCHGVRHRKGQLVATMVSTPDYPPLIVYQLLNQLLDQFIQKHESVLEAQVTSDQALEFSALSQYISKYQDPAAADQITQIKQGINDTTEVVMKTIDQVLERGQTLESLMEKSDDLSGASLQFYRTSKKTRCCTIL